ncbi:MAG: urease accessory protein UreD [Pseudazoarcus pumilus]|nr:urease accessory protein UreD [Pseudazoarcus pumilus]
MKPDDPPTAVRAAGWQAALALDFERRDARSVLAGNRHVGPLRVQKPLYPEGEGVCHAIVLHPPAGIVGGDTLDIAVQVGAGAHALLTTPGAGKWYRSAGAPATLRQSLRVEDGAVCEWLPQETLVFDGAIGDQSTHIELAPHARFIGSEMLCFGRTASGERFTQGQFSMCTRIRRGGETLWLERGHIAGGSPLLDSPVGLNGQPVAGTLWIIGPEVDEALRNACREIEPAIGHGAVTLLPGVLVARWLGPACEPGREWFARLWAVARPALAGREAVIPRIWNT